MEERGKTAIFPIINSKKQTKAAFDNLDKSYVEVLRQYDEEMAVHNWDLSNANKVLDEKVHERN